MQYRKLWWAVLCFIASLTVASPSRAEWSPSIRFKQLQAAFPSRNWINVADYGAGDGVHDTEGTLKALDHAIHDFFGSATVYFPKAKGESEGYWFPNGLTLPYTAGKWIELYLDDNLGFGGSLVLPSTGHYYIYGHGGGQTEQFDTQPTSIIWAGPGASPGILMHRAANITLENLSVRAFDGDGIRIEGEHDGQSAYIKLKQVFAVTDQTNPTGIPLHIRGGFGYFVEGGGFVSPPGSNQPSVLIEDEPDACVGTAMMRFDRPFLANHGIEMFAHCGGIANVSINMPLYEEGRDALVTIRETWAGLLYGIRLQDCIIADSGAAALDNHSPRTTGVMLDNCVAPGGDLTTGDPVNQLYVWLPREPQRPDSPPMPKIAQKSGYELHVSDRIIYTIPFFQAKEWDASVTPPADPPAPTGPPPTPTPIPTPTPSPRPPIRIHPPQPPREPEPDTPRERQP